jgi:ribonuclease-3
VQGHLRLSALEDAFEALVGAIFTDTENDLGKTADIVLSWYGDVSVHLHNQEQDLNPKGRLQEIIQPKHGNDALSYVVIRMDGEPHEREFEIEVFLFDQSLGSGIGKSKKEAEEEAARQALLKIAP